MEDVLTLSRDEIVERIDREARRRLRISAEELLRRYRAGELDDPGYVADLIMLADLLPDDDALFAAA
jgi:hypothetical protein